MSVRIYALAKELGIDSKECVDLCAKAGVTGKGSALASLNDEEEARVRAYIATGTGKSPARAAAAVSGKGGGVATLAPPEPPPISREAYMPPGGTLGKPPVLPAKAAAVSKPERVERPVEPPKKPAAEGPKAPVIRVAPLPTAQQPPPLKKAAEPAAQKPIIKLPADVRSGRAPLAAQIKKREEQRVDSAQTPAGKKPGEARAPAAAGPLVMPDVSRPRRGKAAAGTEDTQMGTREDRQRNRKRTVGVRPGRVTSTGVKVTDCS